MSKAENRAAAKAYAREQERKRREMERATAIKGELEQLKVFRKYLIFNALAPGPAQNLMNAIDDYVEELTGDRRALHEPNHSIS